MLPIETMKKAVPFADGFSLSLSGVIGNYLIMPNNDKQHFNYGMNKTFNKIYYPFFLSAVIDGINRDSEGILIDTGSFSIQVRIERNGKPTIFESFSIVSDISKTRANAIIYSLGFINDKEKPIETKKN